ncbi:MAG: hypothetical protein FJ109_21910, partial [Deltaproteobacteria bacterium]|nr:hypothetical protein [Deltaproteobacteria bacterium]
MKLRPASAALVGLFFFGIASIGCDMENSKEDAPDCDGHALGEEWDVGCNTCICESSGMSCTLLECPETCPGGSEVGSSWPAEDGCNTCSCMKDLTVACTAMACPPPAC